MQENSTNSPAQPDEFSSFHPVLQPMRRTCEHIFEAGDFERAFPILGALCVLNGRRSFWQPAAHEHFTAGEEGQGNARD